MNPVSSIDSMPSWQIQLQQQVLALKKQQDVAQEMGDLALKLIQSAAVPPGSGVGQYLDVTA